MKNKFFEIIGLITIIAFVSLACGSDSGGGNNGNTTYAITMEDNGNGSAEAIPNTAAEGDTVTISATPDNGYKFKEWESGSVTLSSNTTATATFTMPGNAVTIRAIFEEVDGPYLILSSIKFSDVEYNYSRPAAKPITITNTGTETANVSKITFGGDAVSFEFTGDSSIINSTIAAGGNKAFNVQPIAGLDAGTYSATITVTYDDGETAINNVSFVVDKTNGAVISAPTLASKTLDSITILAVTPANGQTVEYGISEINDAATVSNWQTTLTFGGLNAGATYYIFARAIANNNYNASSGTSLVVTLDSGGVTMDVPGANLKEMMEFLNNPANVQSNSTYTLNFGDTAAVNDEYTPGDTDYDEDDDEYEYTYIYLSYPGKSNITINFTGGGIISLESTSKGMLIYVGENVTLNLENITLKGSVANDGRNNPVVGVDGNLTMKEGSTVTDNGSTGVRVYSGTFTMNGGKIFGNDLGVHVSGTGIFTMDGGEISDNQPITYKKGGGVWVETDLGQSEREEKGLPPDINAKFIMNKGIISNNKTTGQGGGVNVADGTFEMNGGEISNNTAGQGGGVYVGGWYDSEDDIDSYGIFIMTGGTIYGGSDSSANNDSGGANSLTVSDNTSTKDKATAKYKGGKDDGKDIVSLSVGYGRETKTIKYPEE